MEERDALLAEVKQQNRYLKSQLNCIRVIMSIMLLVIAGIGAAICVGYPGIQRAAESVTQLEREADETLTGIQTMSSHTDQMVQQAGEILESLKPQAEELGKIDMEMFVKNINDLSQSVEALDLEKLQQSINALQKAIDAIIAVTDFVQ